MPNYKAMYYALFNSLTDAIKILQKAQQEGERLFIDEKKNPKMELITRKGASKDNPK